MDTSDLSVDGVGDIPTKVHVVIDRDGEVFGVHRTPEGAETARQQYAHAYPHTEVFVQETELRD